MQTEKANAVAWTGNKEGSSEWDAITFATCSGFRRREGRFLFFSKVDQKQESILRGPAINRQINRGPAGNPQAGYRLVSHTKEKEPLPKFAVVIWSFV